MGDTGPSIAEIERRERVRDLMVPEDAMRYLKAHKVLTELRQKYLKRRITYEQYKVLRNMAIAGDNFGAVKGLGDALAENERKEHLAL